MLSVMRLIGILLAVSAAAQPPAAPTRADILRGAYGEYRANNDLLYYHLDVRVDPEKKFLSGKNTIRFRMLKDDSRIQLDLHEALKVDQILLMGKGQGARGKEQSAKGQGQDAKGQEQSGK